MLVMLDFLNEIRATGKITRAAGRAQMSYRHCWNLIEKWAAFFGAPLVEREQGRGTKLTALGEKLVWAGQRLQARLRPAAAEPGAGARVRDQRVSAAAHAPRAHPCEPRVRGVETARDAAARAASGHRSALREQPEFAGLARRRRLRNSGHASSARRAAQAGRGRPQAVARAGGTAGHRTRHARDGADGEARQPVGHHLARAPVRQRRALRQPRPGIGHAPAVRSVAEAARARRRRGSAATSASNSPTPPSPRMSRAAWPT